MPFSEPISVSEFVFQVKNSLETEFRNVSVIGEISNLSKSISGHIYFSLKDKDSLLQIALFKGDAFRNPIINEVKEGDEIQVFGNISVYPKRGSFQLIAKVIKKKGKGDLKQQFELLKRTLSEEGLFDISKKKGIPSIPRKIAVVTAPGAAALQDFLKVYRRRGVWKDILIFPSLVQGADAPKSIINALELVKKYQAKNKNIDAVVLTRGGGSIEDLWSFNDEKLIRFLYSFELPTISAVGHQVDYCLSDFVCDLRAETPTAAAELLTQEQFSLNEKLSGLKKDLENLVKIQFNECRELVQAASPRALLSKIIEQYSRLELRMERCNLIKRGDEALGLNNFDLRLDEAMSSISNALEGTVMESSHRLKRLEDMLGALNPNNVLQRGYSYCTDQNGNLLGNYDKFDKLRSGQEFVVNFHGGKGEVQKI